MRILVNGFGAHRGGIVRVHNAICEAACEFGSVDVASAPAEQQEIARLRILSTQRGGRLKSFLTDVRAAVKMGSYDVRIDSAPAFRFLTWSRYRVVVVHDLNFLNPSIHQISRLQQMYRALLHRVSVARADLVVVNSESTLAELVRYVPRIEPKVRVQALPVGDSFKSAPPRGAAEPDVAPIVRVLTFGHAQNKGVDCLLRAMKVHADLALQVVCTEDEWRCYWEELAHRLEVSDRVTLLSSIDDPELVAAYRECSVFAMLSSYEGYGMPVTEALALATPTVISDLPVLRHVSQGAAVVVDRHNEQDVYEGLRSAMKQPSSRWDDASRPFRATSWRSWTESLIEGAR